MVAKTLKLATICGSLLVVVAVQSRAALTLADWEAADQVSGNATWHLLSASQTLKDINPSVSFDDFLNNQVQTTIAFLRNTTDNTVTYDFDYTVSLSGGFQFKSVQVDTLYATGNSTVTKDIGEPVSLTVTSINGAPSPVGLVPNLSSSIKVHETIAIGKDTLIFGVIDSYTVVPEPGTILAAALLLLPLGACGMRFLNQNKST